MNPCSVDELQEKRDRQDAFLLVDVRSAEELAIASLDGACHIPLDELHLRLDAIADWKDGEVICMCHHGVRSAYAEQILRQAGFKHVRNLIGGIHAWSANIDSRVPMY